MITFIRKDSLHNDMVNLQEIGEYKDLKKEGKETLDSMLEKINSLASNHLVPYLFLPALSMIAQLHKYYNNYNKKEEDLNSIMMKKNIDKMLEDMEERPKENPFYYTECLKYLYCICKKYGSVSLETH